MKEIIIGTVFIFGALIFIFAGFYFKSEKYISSLCDGIFDEKLRKEKEFFGKATGYFSMALGSLTLVSGILFFLFPQIKYSVALFYIIAFALIVMIYMAIFSKSKEKK